MTSAVEAKKRQAEYLTDPFKRGLLQLGIVKEITPSIERTLRAINVVFRPLQGGEILPPAEENAFSSIKATALVVISKYHPVRLDPARAVLASTDQVDEYERVMNILLPNWRQLAQLLAECVRGFPIDEIRELGKGLNKPAVEHLVKQMAYQTRRPTPAARQEMYETRRLIEEGQRMNERIIGTRVGRAVATEAVFTKTIQQTSE